MGKKLLWIIVLISILFTSSVTASSYTHSRIINCTAMSDLVPLVINGSNGFTINGEKQVVWTYCYGNTTELYYNNETDYIVVNGTHQLPHEVEVGNGTSYNYDEVWSEKYISVWHASNANDSLNRYNGTVTSASLTSGLVGNAYSYAAGNKITYTTAQSLGFTTGDFSVQFMVKPDAVTNDQVLGRGGWKDDGYNIIIAAEDKIGLLVSKTGDRGFSFTNNCSFKIGVWHHVVINKIGNPATSQVWINGTSCGLTQGDPYDAGQPTNNSARLFQTGGVDGHPCYGAFEGVLDEVRVEDSSASSSFVKQTWGNLIGTSGYGELGGEIIAVVGTINVSIEAPANDTTTTDTTPAIQFNYTSDTLSNANCTLYFNGTAYDNNATVNNATTTNLIPTALSYGEYYYWITCVNGATTNTSENNTLIIVQRSTSSTIPVWTTTGGFSSGNRIYGQTIDNVTANGTVTNPDGSGVLGMNITVTSSGGTVVDNEAMTNISGNSTTATFKYDTDFILDVAGTWTVTTKAIYGNYTSASSSNIDVVTSNFTVSTNHYGFTTGNIPTENQISEFIADYTYDLLEITDNITTMTANWPTILSRFNVSYNSNLVGGLNIILDVDCTDQLRVDVYKTQIASNFPDLLTGNYQSAIIYLSLEFLNNSYSPTEADNCFNNISKELVSATNNQFIVYSKGYNSSGLDTSYISPTPMRYNEEIYQHTFINWEAATSRNTTYLNRIYNVVEQHPDMLDIGQDLHDKAYSLLRTGINASTTIVNTSVAELTNGDLIVFNNLSIDWVERSITVKTGLSKDIYDYTNKDIIEMNNDLTFPVNVYNYSASYLMLDDFDNYQMTSNTEGTLYKATTSGWQNFSWDNGVKDAANDVSTAIRKLIYLYDPTFSTTDVYMVYYGWLNASYVQNWTMYDFIIIADKNDGEIDLIVEQTDVLGYIGVFDYNQSNTTWVTQKKLQIDEWLAFNTSMAGIFLDGLDSATIINATDFELKFKQVVDYVRIDKGKLAYLNTYTYSEDYCTWGDACMKESCVRRWNGTNASAPTAYDWEDWDLELEKSSFYNSHNIQIICQGFDNRTAAAPYQIYNYTRMINAYYASKVLGYEYWSWHQPDFQYTPDIYIPDVGTDLASTWQTDDNETYYRLYSNGVVYYNKTSHHGWQDNGREIEGAKLHVNLYDNGGSALDYNILVSDGETGSTEYVYTLTTPGSAWGYVYYNLTLNESNWYDIGRYRLEFYSPYGAGTAYLGMDTTGTTWQGYRSWGSADSGVTWTGETENYKYLSTLELYDAKKASLDSGIEIVTETDTLTTYYENTSIEGDNAWYLKTWSLPVSIRAKEFYNLSYWNGTAYNNLYPRNTTTCDTDSPWWNTTAIDGDSYHSCFEQDEFNYIYRVVTPNMTQSDILFFREPPQYVNDIYVTPTNPRYNQNLNCNFNVTSVDNTTNLNVSITWYNSSDNSSWSNVGDYNVTYYNVTFDTLYTTTVGNGSVTQTLDNYTYWKCNIGVDDGERILYESSSVVPVYPLENLTVYSDVNETERNGALNATFSVIDYDGGIECLLDINESGINYTYDINHNDCYQETANVATNCGGLNTGTYSFVGTFFGAPEPKENLNDGDYSTYTHPLPINNNHVYMYVNYTKPNKQYVNATWQTKNNNGLFNDTVPDACFNAYEDKLMFQVDLYQGTIGTNAETFWNCYNGSSWQLVRASGPGLNDYQAYEEAIFWNSEKIKTNSWVFQNKNDYIGYEFYNPGAGGWYWYNYTNRLSPLLNWSMNYINATGDYKDVEIPSSCHATSVVQIRETFDVIGDRTLQCYNTTHWEDLFAMPSGDIYTGYGLEWILLNDSVNNGTNTTIQYIPSAGGPYDWNISCTATGNEIPLISDSRAFRYDIVGPWMDDYGDDSTADYPEIGDGIVLNVTINDMFTIDQCQLQIHDNGTWWNSTSYAGISAYEEYNLTMGWVVRPVSTANNTVIWWRVACADLAGNWNTSVNQSFIVKDRTFPVISNATSGNNWLANVTKQFGSLPAGNVEVITDSGLVQGIINVNRHNLSMNFTYYDYNLFQVEQLVICDINGTIDNYTMMDYNSSNLTVTRNVSLSGMDFQRCSINISVSDDHTTEKIPNYKINKINNGVEYLTENKNLVTVELTPKDIKDKKWIGKQILGKKILDKPLIGNTDIKKITTNKKKDRYNFEFEFEEPIQETTFTIKANNKIYYREGSNYPAHFVIWNEELKSGNWVDFAELGIGKNQYSVNKISDYEFEVTINLDVPQKNFMFESIGGLNVYNATYFFYTGGEVNISSNNLYDNTSISDWNITVTTLNAYPGWNGSAVINDTWVLLENVTNGTYQLDFSHYCFFPQTDILNISNVTQNLTWESWQAEWSFQVDNVATGTLLEGWNVSIYNTDSGQWHNFTNVSSVSNLILNATTYTVNISASGYEDNIFNYTFGCKENLTNIIHMSFLATFFLYDENTLDVFNVSSPDTIYFVLICPNSTETSVISTNVSTIPITCDYDKFRFILDYGSTSYYRTFILEPDDALSVDVFLIDAATTTYVSNNFIVDDLVDDYEDVQVYIYKMIGDAKTQITADWIDIESKITAYLIQNHEYIVEIHSSNNPVRIMGNYVASESGDKALKLYSIDLDYATTSYVNNIHVAMGKYNGTNETTNTSDIYAVLRLQGYSYIASPEKNLTYVQYDLMLDSCEAPAFYTWTENDTSILWTTTGIEHTYNISEYENRTICSNTTIVGTAADGTTDTHTFTKLIQTYEKIQQEIFEYVSHNWMNWLIMILLGTIALMGSLKSENYAILGVVLLGALLATFGWFTIGGGVLAVAVLIAVVSIFKTKEKKLY